MESRINLLYVKSEEDIEHFWERRNEHFLKIVVYGEVLKGGFYEFKSKGRDRK